MFFWYRLTRVVVCSLTISNSQVYQVRGHPTTGSGMETSMQMKQCISPAWNWILTHTRPMDCSNSRGS